MTPKAELHAAQQRRHGLRLALHRAALETDRALALINQQQPQIREAIQQEADLLRRAMRALKGREG